MTHTNDLITITDRFVIASNDLYNTVPLEGGKTYLMHINPLHTIIKNDLGQKAKGYECLRHLTQNDLRAHTDPLRVLFLFDGGLGDAVSLAILLDALKTEYNFLCSVACKYEIWQTVLWPLGFRGNWFQMPIRLEHVQAHDYIQTKIDRFFRDIPDVWDLCIINEMGMAYGVDLSDRTLSYGIPDLVLKRTVLPDTSRLRIGVNLDSKGLIRSYPPSLQPRLIKYLLEAGFEVFLLGLHEPHVMGLNNDGLFNFCGKTTVMELAALIQQMDMILCTDSFIAHLSNVLEIQTMALLSVTRKGIYDWHKYVTCLESSIPCSPCGEVGNKCPRRLNECEAFFHESIRPETITQEVIRQCANHLNTVIGESLFHTLLSH
jgi:hypothetical protein